jgi:membrane-associated phospholipid phosphatase
MKRGRFRIFRDALYTTLRWTAEHVSGFFGALAAFVTVSLAVGVAAAMLFAAFARFVMSGVTQNFDDEVLRWISTHRTPGLNEVMLEITTLGSGMVLIVLVLVASVFLWLTKHHWSVYILLVGVVGGQLMNRLLKNFFERPRPSIVEWVTEVSSKSFPSGHAMTAMITYGSVAYLVARLEPTDLLRRTTWAIAALFIFAIGISRMYLGVHYPSDIVAGYLAGVAWLAFVATSLAAVRYFAPRRPATRREEHDLNARASGTTGKAA